jgi:hypothetical protein
MCSEVKTRESRSQEEPIRKKIKKFSFEKPQSRATITNQKIERRET